MLKLGWRAFARKGAACKGKPTVAPTEFKHDCHSTNVPIDSQSTVVDVYSVGPRECEPFEIQLRLVGKEGARMEIRGLVDDRAMVAAKDTRLFKMLQEALEGVKPPSKRLRMANGTIVPSEAHWEGTIGVGELTHKENSRCLIVEAAGTSYLANHFSKHSKRCMITSGMSSRSKDKTNNHHYSTQNGKEMTVKMTTMMMKTSRTKKTKQNLWMKTRSKWILQMRPTSSHET